MKDVCEIIPFYGRNTFVLKSGSRRHEEEVRAPGQRVGPPRRGESGRRAQGLRMSRAGRARAKHRPLHDADLSQDSQPALPPTVPRRSSVPQQRRVQGGRQRSAPLHPQWR